MLLERGQPAARDTFSVGASRMRNLPRRERETITNFNAADDIADVFTYDRRWQRHIEKRLGIQPYQVNAFGGRFYELPKKAISKPSIRGPQKLTPRERARRRESLSKIRARLQNSGGRIGSSEGPGIDSTRSKRKARGSGDGGGTPD